MYLKGESGLANAAHELSVYVNVQTMPSLGRSHGWVVAGLAPMHGGLQTRFDWALQQLLPLHAMQLLGDRSPLCRERFFIVGRYAVNELDEGIPPDIDSGLEGQLLGAPIKTHWLNWLKAIRLDSVKQNSEHLVPGASKYINNNETAYEHDIPYMRGDAPCPSQAG